MGRRADELLKDIIEELHFLEEATRGQDLEDLQTDAQFRKAVERSLEIIGEATKALSQEIRSAHPDVPWSDMARMRDMLIHAYHRVEPESLWRTVMEDAIPLLPRIERLLADSKGRSGPQGPPP